MTKSHQGPQALASGLSLTTQAGQTLYLEKIYHLFHKTPLWGWPWAKQRGSMNYFLTSPFGSPLDPLSQSKPLNELLTPLSYFFTHSSLWCGISGGANALSFPGVHVRHFLPVKGNNLTPLKGSRDVRVKESPSQNFGKRFKQMLVGPVVSFIALTKTP